MPDTRHDIQLKLDTQLLPVTGQGVRPRQTVAASLVGSLRPVAGLRRQGDLGVIAVPFADHDLYRYFFYGIKIDIDTKKCIDIAGAHPPVRLAGQGDQPRRAHREGRQALRPQVQET